MIPRNVECRDDAVRMDVSRRRQCFGGFLMGKQRCVTNPLINGKYFKNVCCSHNILLPVIMLCPLTVFDDLCIHNPAK